jgi:hypothetical protein
MVGFVIFILISVSVFVIRDKSAKKSRKQAYSISNDQRTELILFYSRASQANRLQKKYDRMAARNQDGQLSFEAPDRDSGNLSLKKKK